MDVLLLYCDSGAPSRFLRFLEIGTCHQVLADSDFKVQSLLVPRGASAETLAPLLREVKPRLAGICFDEFNTAASMLAVDALRKFFPDTQICAFGIFPVLNPDRVFSNAAIHHMIIGEPEKALHELATTVVRGGDLRGIRNLWYRSGERTERNPLRQLLENLDQLPYPDRSLFAQDTSGGPTAEETLYVAASRGCPYECLFCYVPVMRKAYLGKGTFYRTRSAPHVAAEILAAMRQHPYTRICFADEMFSCDRLWLRELARRLSGTDLPPMEATIAVDKCDEDILDQYQAIGIARLTVGVETGNEAFRRRIAGRNLENTKITAIASAARERGMQIVTASQFGFPLESQSLAQETVALSQSLAAEEIRVTVYQPVEGTMLHGYAREKGILFSETATGGPDFTRPALQLPDFSPDEIQKQVSRMVLLDLSHRLRALPPVQEGTDLLRELPRARFRLTHNGAMALGTARKGSEHFGYLALEAGSECQFNITLPAASMIRFSLYVPRSTALLLQAHDASIVADVVWQPGEGEGEVLFSRFISGGESSLCQRWKPCLIYGPPDGGPGLLVLRAKGLGAPQIRAGLLWGRPAVTTALPSMVLDGSPSEKALAQLEELTAENSLLRSELLRLTDSEKLSREERDRKSQRLGELQIRVVELEKQLEEQRVLLRELQSGEGLGEKLKGIFRKSS